MEKEYSDFLYSDNLVTIYQDTVIFHNCFLLWKDKTVLVSAIEKIEAVKPTVWNGKGRLWGTRGPNIWFAMDWKRPSRDRLFFATIKDYFWKIGFTVKDAALVENIFREMGLVN